MIRVILISALAASLSGCGLLIDGAYLISNKTYSKDEKQSRPLDLQQTAFEHEVRGGDGVGRDGDVGARDEVGVRYAGRDLCWTCGREHAEAAVGAGQCDERQGAR